MDLRELEEEGRKRCWEWGRTRAPGRDGTNRDHGGPANRGVLHEAMDFWRVAFYTWHFWSSITAAVFNDAYGKASMYATYMGQKPCIDEGHGMTQERDLYIQLDMANGERAVVFLFALEEQ